MRRLTAEEGSAAPIIAVILVVLLAAVGLAVDAGLLYWERGQLQNGADAAVLAIATDCARGTAACNQATAELTAKAFADDNAGDGHAGVDTVTIDPGARTVTVITSTLDPDGDTNLDPLVAQVVGYGGTTVRARASATWGPAGSLETLPLIISECEWGRLADHGNNLYDPEALPPAGDPTVLYFHSDAEPCNIGESGFDLPGGFGWLATDGDCSAEIDSNSWVFDDPGASPSTGCSPDVLEDIVGTVVLIPWFIEVEGLGSNGRYLVENFAAFYVTGYNFAGQYKEPSAAEAPCKGEERCLAGYFTYSADPDGDIGGEDRGVRIVKLTG